MTDASAPSEIGRDAESGEAVVLPAAERVLGVGIVGKSGTGKSSIMEHLILDDLQAGTPGMVIDPHGRLAQRIISAATPEQAEKIILLEASPDAPFGLNLLALRRPVNATDDVVTWAVDTVVETIKKLYNEQDSYAPRLERYLRLAARTLIPAGRTLVDVPRLFEDDRFRAWCLSQAGEAGLSERWAAYQGLRPADRLMQVESLMNRMDAIIDSPLLRAMVGSRETTVPFDSILAGDSMLLVSLPSETLGRARCDFIGSMLLCELANRIFSRTVASATPPRLHLYLDEYQRFATSTTADFLEEGRKYNLGVVLAHQTLYQIEDPRIRNAARHAGTLIAMGVTRPDADQLAGEFPIEAREEWIETITEPEGTEPGYVFSPTPAEDIFLNGHSDPHVDKIARSLFAFTPKWTNERIWAALGIKPDSRDTVQFLGDHRKSAGVEPRPGGHPTNPRVQMAAYDANDLLTEAMAGRLRTPEAFVEKLLWAETWSPQVQLGLPESGREPVTVSLRDAGPSTMFYYIANRSGSRIAEPECNCPPPRTYYGRGGKDERIERATPEDPLGIHLVGCPAVRGLTEKEKARNRKVQNMYLSVSKSYIDRVVRKWLAVQIEDRDALRRDENTPAMRKMYFNFVVGTWMNCFSGRWEWSGTVFYEPDGAANWRPREPGDLITTPWPKARIQEYAEMVQYALSRVRYLHYLCEVLERQPVMVPSGERQARMRTRHIVHSAQTQQDALNEFASNLAHPPEQYVAHVRMPQRYHRTKLSAPVQLVAGREQLEEVRRASRELYRCQEGNEAPPDKPAGPVITPPTRPPEPRKRISRRPGSVDPAQGMLGDEEGR